MDRKKIKQTINIYAKELSKKIKVDKIVLFGSAANGKMKKDSDLDLVVLSRSFEKMGVDKRFDLLYTSRSSFATQSTPMDIFGLTPKEYREASPLSIVGEIKEKGKAIASIC